MRKTMLRNYLYDNALRKTTFLCCKSMVFGVQKPYFCRVKNPFLKNLFRCFGTRLINRVLA